MRKINLFFYCGLAAALTLTYSCNEDNSFNENAELSSSNNSSISIREGDYNKFKDEQVFSELAKPFFDYVNSQNSLTSKTADFYSFHLDSSKIKVNTFKEIVSYSMLMSRDNDPNSHLYFENLVVQKNIKLGTSEAYIVQ